jgi:hypothetical protein
VKSSISLTPVLTGVLSLTAGRQSRSTEQNQLITNLTDLADAFSKGVTYVN